MLGCSSESAVSKSHTRLRLALAGYTTITQVWVVWRGHQARQKAMKKPGCKAALASVTQQRFSTVFWIFSSNRESRCPPGLCLDMSCVSASCRTDLHLQEPFTSLLKSIPDSHPRFDVTVVFPLCEYTHMVFTHNHFRINWLSLKKPVKYESFWPPTWSSNMWIWWVILNNIMIFQWSKMLGF